MIYQSTIIKKGKALVIQPHRDLSKLLKSRENGSKPGPVKIILLVPSILLPVSVSWKPYRNFDIFNAIRVDWQRFESLVHPFPEPRRVVRGRRPCEKLQLTKQVKFGEEGDELSKRWIENLVNATSNRNGVFHLSESVLKFLDPRTVTRRGWFGERMCWDSGAS